MLTNDIIQALKNYFGTMQNSVAFVLKTAADDVENPAKRAELKEFLTGIANTSDKLELIERDDKNLRSPLSFSIEVDGKDTGISFAGIPSGHEFNSLVLAVLQVSGTPIKLDDSLKKLIASIDQELNFEVFVSLSCHNCPDVVQALNQFAVINPNISAEMIDGGLFQSIIEERDIQGVPSVYLNGELFANGKVDAAQLIEKLMPFVQQQTNDEEALPLQDVVVIGGGPAGVSSAIYSARKGLAVTVIADRIGGQVKDTMDIENLISVPKTTGPQLSGALQQHLNEYDITLKEHLRVESVEDKDVQSGVKTITLSSGEVIKTKTLIIATGAKWRELGVPGEKENIGNGVAYCPHCDGPFFKGKDVAVVGGGNSGIEAALDLAGITQSVTVFEFLSELKADKVLVDKAQATDNVTIITEAAVQEIIATNGKVSAIRYIDRSDNTEKTVELEGVFVQIGLVPNSHFLADVVERTQHGEIVINEKGETSAPGIFAAGDVTTVPYKQIVVAMGEGAKASLSAFEHLLTHEPVEPQAIENEAA